MPAHRKSENSLRLSGTYRADRHDRSIRINDPIDNTPPPLMPAHYLPAWEELCAAGAAHLEQRDRIAVEFCAGLMTAQREGTASPGNISTFMRLLDELGLTPVARGRVAAVRPGINEIEENPFAKFLR